MFPLKTARFVIALSMVLVIAVPTAAFGATTFVNDPTGEDYPDIAKLTLENNQGAVVLKQKYTDVNEPMVHSLYIKWGDATHYRINHGDYDANESTPFTTHLYLSTPDGDREKICDTMTAVKNQDTDVLKVRVPRSCLPKADNRVFAKGVATAGGPFAIDQTARTAKVSRG